MTVAPDENGDVGNDRQDRRGVDLTVRAEERRTDNQQQHERAMHDARGDDAFLERRSISAFLRGFGAEREVR